MLSFNLSHSFQVVVEPPKTLVTIGTPGSSTKVVDFTNGNGENLSIKCKLSEKFYISLENVSISNKENHKDYTFEGK